MVDWIMGFGAGLILAGKGFWFEPGLRNGFEDTAPFKWHKQKINNRNNLRNTSYNPTLKETKQVCKKIKNLTNSKTYIPIKHIIKSLSRLIKYKQKNRPIVLL